MHAACALNQSGYPDALEKQLASLRFLLQFLVMFGVQLRSIALSPEFNCKCSPTISHQPSGGLKICRLEAHWNFHVWGVPCLPGWLGHSFEAGAGNFSPLGMELRPIIQHQINWVWKKLWPSSFPSYVSRKPWFPPKNSFRLHKGCHFPRPWLGMRVV